VDERGVADEPTGAATAGAPKWGDRARAIGIVSVLLAARRGDRRREDDAGRDGALGSLMRHFLSPGAVARLARGVVPATAATMLVPSPGGAQRRLPRLPAARSAAIAIATIAVATQEKDAPAVRARADDQAKRVQAPPRSGGRAGHSRGDMR
jgi:hypothetical protein